MTDIVEELWASDDASALTNRAAREIERLRAVETMRDEEIADVREKHGNALIELDRLREEVTRVEGQRNASNRHIENLADHLYASQAREAKLRWAMIEHHDQNCHQMRGPFGEQWRDDSRSCTCWVGDAISLPHDDSALKERLRQERERCAEECDRRYYDQGHECAAAIRAMGESCS